MIFRYDSRETTWVDLEQPTMDEIRSIAREFSIGDRFEMELLSPTPLPLVATDSGTAMLVLHFPAYAGEDGDTKTQEIDFIVGPRFIVTVRYEVVASIHRLKKLLETDAFLSEPSGVSNDMLLEILFSHLYTSVRDHALHTAGNLSKVEKDMFEGRERKTVRAVSIMSREFVHLEAALASQEEPLARFLRSLTERKIFETPFSERGARILAERIQIMHLVRTYRAVAAELRETNAALLEARQNEIMKALTTITVVVLPLELIAFVFGMHAPGTPFEQDPNAFWIIMGFMLGSVALTTLLFAKKRWIF